MTEQRTIIIAPLPDLGEVWISSSHPFDSHKEYFKETLEMLSAMKRQKKIWDFEVQGEKTVVITPQSANDWPNVEDMFLEHFVPGISGVKTEVAVFDRGAEAPRRRFLVDMDDKTKARSITEVQLVAAA